MPRPDVHPRPWRPSLAIKGSLVLHAFALAACLLPGAWPYALAALIANHAWLTGLGLWPRSQLLGLNHTQLPDDAKARGLVALTIDDGPDPTVTPRVLDILDEYQATASFFCIGSVAEQHPALVQEIVRRSHRIENHTQHHPYHFSFMGMSRLRREIGAAQDCIEKLSGRRPRFFRAPAGLRSPMLDPVLHSLQLELASWTKRGFDTRERDARRVLARLTHDLKSGDILLVHDGNAQINCANQPNILTVLPQLLDAIRARGLHCVSLDRAFSASHDSQ